MPDSTEDELTESYNQWLDANMEVFGQILQEWEDNDFISPVPGAQAEFQCNDCGKCCNFADHAVWVYPYDMVKWLQQMEDVKEVPLFLSALFPVEDLDGIQGYGLPSQREISERYQEMIREHKKDPLIPKTLRAILQALKAVNPGFNPKSEQCIYYLAGPPKGSGHCAIYEHRPIQCRAYPYDFPQFTKFDVPGFSDDADPGEAPMCPPETFTGGTLQGGVKISDEALYDVVLEKANYKTTAVVHDWGQESEDWRAIYTADICDLLLQLFHKNILFFNRDARKVPASSGQQKRYVAGKRPTKRRG